MKTTSLIANSLVACAMVCHGAIPFNTVDRTEELTEADWIRIEEAPQLRHTGVFTGIVYANELRDGVAESNRPLDRKGDPSFADPRWHQEVGERFQISRSIPTAHFYTREGRVDYAFTHIATKVPNVWRYTASSAAKHAAIVKSRKPAPPVAAFPAVQPPGPAVAPITYIIPPSETPTRLEWLKPSPLDRL